MGCGNGSKKSGAVTVKKMISVLPNDYSLLVNRPAIDGVTLEAGTTSEELGLLTKDASSYAQLSILEADTESVSVLVAGEDGEVGLVSLSELAEKIAPITVTYGLDEDAEIGTIQIVITD